MPKEIKKPKVPFENGETVFYAGDDGKVYEAHVEIQSWGPNGIGSMIWVINTDDGEEFCFENDWCRTVFPSYEDAEKSLRLKARDTDA